MAKGDGSVRSTAKPKARLAEDTAARPILDEAELLEDQRKILKRILHRVRDFAVEEGRKEASRNRDQYRRELHLRRPRQVFFIDGVRGAGKTSLLLTLREYLGFLGDSDRWCTSFGVDDALIARALKNFGTSILSQIGGAGAHDDDADAFYQAPVNVGANKRRVACILDVLYPSDLEGGQPVMEGIFAFMNQRLADEQRNIEEKRCGDWQERVKRAKDLQRHLVRKISPGWYLSKSEGKDAIVRDSSDYENFLEKMGTASVRAFSRVSDFRNFVLDYLDFFNSELLVIFFDDTDVTPQVTRDMLHTIRIFLDHPRIVTVIAGHLKSMRQSLIWEYLGEIKEPIDAVVDLGGTAANEWRQFQQQQVEEYLEKVLPRQFRNLIRVEHAYDFDDVESGPSKVFDSKFSEFCASVQEQLLPEFVMGKHRAHMNDTKDHLEIPDEKHRSGMENWMAWYLLRHHYAEPLKPRSVRGQVAMNAMAKPALDSPMLSDKLPSGFRRRLAVFLFENPDNFELVQRFGDADTRVMRWLRRQHLTARWTGERYFEINGTKIYEGTYSYSYISFRADLGISIPVRENAEDQMPAGLLGTPAGPNLIADRPFYPGMHRQRLLGVAGVMRHSVIPANCLYLWDLQCLPDVVWQDHANPRSNPWGSRLIYEWPNLFVFETSDWNSAQHADANVAEEKSEGTRLKEYLVRVLVPFASVDLGAYVESSWLLKDLSDARNDARIDAPSDNASKLPSPILLADEISYRKDIAEVLAQADVIRRRYDYLETIGKDSTGWSAVSEESKELITEWGDSLVNLLLPDKLRADKRKRDRSQHPEELSRVLRHHLRSYQWILNDLRRAAHAVRIFANEVAPTLRRMEQRRREAAAKTDPKGVALEPIVPRTRRDLFRRTDRYTVLTQEAMDRWVVPVEEHLEGLLSDPGVATLKHLGIDRAAMELLIRDLESHYGYKLNADGPEEFCFENLTRGVKSTSGPNFPLPLSDDDPGFVVATDIARLARAYFLLLVALAPCLPSLIHVDIASRHHSSSSGTDGWTVKASVALDKWSNRIRKYKIFGLQYRRVLENSKFRQDLLMLNRGDASDEDTRGWADELSNFGARLTLAPDISFNSLGVLGLLNFGCCAASNESDTPFSSESQAHSIVFGKGLERVNSAWRGWECHRKAALKPTMNLTLFQDLWSSLRAAQEFAERLRTITYAQAKSESGRAELLKALTQEEQAKANSVWAHGLRRKKK